MFLPISDSPNPRTTAYATWALIAVNVAVYLLVSLPLGFQPADTADPAFAEYLELLSQLASSRQELVQAANQLSAYDLFVFKHGFRPGAPSLADLLLSMFLHGGLLHLAGNMLFLWIYGDNVEHRLGPARFVLWYLVTGTAATLFHAVFFLSSDIPLVGASGAISGVLGFYFIWFPKNTVRMLFFLPPFLWHVFEIPARIVLLIYLVIDNVLPFIFAGAGGVAHGAHIGGFIAGAGAAWLMARRAAAPPPRDLPPAGARRVSRGTVRDALADGRVAEAAAEYFELPSQAARDALSPAEATALAGSLRQAGHSRAALALLQRAIQLAPRGAPAAELYAAAGVILLDDLGDAPAAYPVLVTALQLGPRPETAAVIRRALLDIESQQPTHPGRWRR
ncbi:MAG TPA: rhomboid family intramembrane serine protease [Candidatus Sulfomarinibacteraceae bacterium]|nr:rhomboid family intramembrane serine protease [Candidatus Sulfomarinibacteraceae bacterium]